LNIVSVRPAAILDEDDIPFSCSNPSPNTIDSGPRLQLSGQCLIGENGELHVGDVPRLQELLAELDLGLNRPVLLLVSAVARIDEDA
jgi:hypothetical protein